MQEARNWWSFTKRFPRQYWFVILLAILQTICAMLTYSAITSTMWLSDDFAVWTIFGRVEHIFIFVSFFTAFILAPLADAIGFRLQLVIGFIVTLIGGALAPAAVSPGLVYLAIGAAAVGEGILFSVLLAAVARLSRPEDRGYAYGVFTWITFTFYYLMTLLLFPVGVYGSYYMFPVSIVVSVISLFLIWRFLHFPPLKQRRPSYFEGMGEMFRKLAKPSILILLLILSLFWFLFYSMDFIVSLTFFSSSFSGSGPVIGYYLILLLVAGLGGFVVANLMDRADPLKFIMAGGALMLIGIAISGFHFNLGLLFFGMLFFYLGQMVIAPSARSLISLQSRPRNMGAIVGLMFLPPMLGWLWYFILSKSGLIYTYSMVGPHLPVGIWALMGALAVAFLILYYRPFGRKLFNVAVDRKWSPRAKDDLWRPAEGNYRLRRPFQTSQWEHSRTAVIFVVLAPFLLLAGYAGGPLEIGPRLEPEALIVDMEGEDYEVDYVDFTFTGVADENSDIGEAFEIHMQRVRYIVVEMFWDAGEPSSFIMGTNEPDEMGFTLTSPTGEQFFSELTYSGSILERFDLDHVTDDHHFSGQWVLELHCGNCGDDHSAGGLRTSSDTDCSYQAEVAVEGYEISR